MSSNLVTGLSPFHVMEVLERAKELEKKGADIIHFEIGEPDLTTHEEICETAVSSIRSGDTRYSESLGLPELRIAISENFAKRYGIKVGMNRVVVTLGSSPAIFLSLLSLIDPGDEVVIIEPYYPCYPQLIRIAGGIPVKFPVSEEDGFQIDVSALGRIINPKTKAIIINSPSNPTGVTLDADIIRDICGLGIRVISDEIYHGLEYGRKAHTALGFSDGAIILNGFSKLYSMTGWRLGYCILPEEFVRPVQKLQQNLFISPNPFVQRAGITALSLSEKQLSEYVNIYNKRRLTMIERLRNIGFNIKTVPDGGFYVFLKVPETGMSSYELAFDILENAGVAVTPGIDFGHGFDSYIRLAYTNDIELIKKGIERLGKYFYRYF